MQKVVSQPAPQALQSDGFRKDILQFLKISDECIPLSACDLQKLNSFFKLLKSLFRMYLGFAILILAEFSNFRMYQRFDQLFNKRYICLNDLRSESDSFRKDILQFSKIGDECITLSASALQKLISFLGCRSRFE